MTGEKTFDCPRWPECGCPDGTIAPDCPGVSRQAESKPTYVGIDLARPDTYETITRVLDGSFTVSRGRL